MKQNFITKATKVLALLVSIFVGFTADAQIREDEIRQSVRDTYKAVEGVDALLDNALSQQIKYGDLTWLEAFRLFIAAESAVDRLKKGEYGSAVVELANNISQSLLSKTAFVSPLANAYAIGSLASLPIDLALRNFAKYSTDTALNWQIELYIRARSPRFNMSHENIMSARSDDPEILFTNDGWLWFVGRETETRSYKPRVPPAGYTREQVFGMAYAIFGARKAESQLPEERLRLENNFLEVLRELEPKQVEGLFDSFPNSASSEVFLGIWEYQESYTTEPMNYLKILEADPGRYRLIEGIKGWYVNDKSRIKWDDQREQHYDPPVIYLRPSDGKLIGEFDSSAFRPTHGETFTFRLTLEPKSRDKILYSVWSSIFGEKETFEATRVGDVAELTEKSSHSGEYVIPKQFHGSWDTREGNVERCMYGENSDTRFTVSSGEIEYYEIDCVLRKVIMSEPNRFSGLFVCEGEGSKSNVQISFDLDHTKLIHKGLGIGISHNTRCN